MDPEGPLETPTSSDRLLQPHMLEFLVRFFAHTESLQVRVRILNPRGFG